MTTTTRVFLVAATLSLAGLASVALHEYLHCAGAGHYKDCAFITHNHYEHVVHANHYTPGDHAWIIPIQLATLTASIPVTVYAWRPRT